MTGEFLKQFQKRKIGLLTDESGSIDRSVLVAPADQISADLVNEILKLSGGHIFVAISPSRADELTLPAMADPRIAHRRSFEPGATPIMDACVSVEAREGVTTGISAADRAITIALLAENPANPRKLVRPGHVFPVVVRPGGVLERNALPEGALDLVKLIDLPDAAVFIDLLDCNGELLDHASSLALAKSHAIPAITLGDLIRYRLETEQLVYKVAEARLPTTEAGEVRSIIYRSKIYGGEHMALVKGEIDPEQPVLTRVQAESTFADVFGGNNPPTRDVLLQSLRAIGANGSGVLIYLRRTDSGYVKNQIENAESKSAHTPAALMRGYGVGAQILHGLGVRKIDLLTSSKKNLIGLQPFGLEIVSQRPIE